MLRNLRNALAPIGGVQALIALGAIAWGLGRLQSLAEERQAHLDHLDAELTARQESLHPSHAEVPVEDATGPATEEEAKA